MEHEESGKKGFVAYDYKEICTDKNKVSFMLDGYENFGWEADGNVYESPEAVQNPHQQKKAILHLKRNRKIVNKTELTRLQRNFEACVNEIDLLEKSKTSKATTYALLLGIVGTAFMAGSVFAVTAPQPHIILCILFAVPGFVGWILPYFVYRKVVREQTEKVNVLIEQKYDEVYSICERGNRLLL